MADPNELRWHDDGHVMTLQLNHAELRVLMVQCPHGPDGACRVDEGCVVELFLQRFGLECNVGVCAPSETVPIAWSFQGSRHDLDAAQVWIIPTTDDVFRSWAATMREGLT